MMASATKITDRLDTPLSAFWPKYEDTDKPVNVGDMANGCTFDHEGRDYQHEGMVVDIILTFTGVFYNCAVTIEDDRGDDWECDAEVIYLVKERDA